MWPESVQNDSPALSELSAAIPLRSHIKAEDVLPLETNLTLNVCCVAHLIRLKSDRAWHLNTSLPPHLISERAHRRKPPLI